MSSTAVPFPWGEKGSSQGWILGISDHLSVFESVSSACANRSIFPQFVVADGKVIFCTPYWDEGVYHGETLPLDQFESLAAGLKSRFFTMDVAKRLNGEWMIIELGDGQVVGLPENADVERFYSSLWENRPDG